MQIAGARGSGLLVAAGQDRSIKLWRTDTRSLARSWRSQGEAPSALGLAPGGRSVASGSAAGSVRLWSTNSSRLQRSFKAHRAASPRSRSPPTTACSPPPARTDRSSCGTCAAAAPPRLARSCRARSTRVAFFPDGRRVLSAGADGVIRIWSSALVLAGQ